MSDWEHGWRSADEREPPHERILDKVIDELEGSDVLMNLGADDKAALEEIIADLNKPDLEVMEFAHRDLAVLVQDIRHRAREAEARAHRSVGGRKSAKTRQAETAARDARIWQQHESGISPAILARRFDLSASQIRRILKRRA